MHNCVEPSAILGDTKNSFPYPFPVDSFQEHKASSEETRAGPEHH
jgi:hypothetical protein